MAKLSLIFFRQHSKIENIFKMLQLENQLEESSGIKCMEHAINLNWKPDVYGST